MIVATLAALGAALALAALASATLLWQLKRAAKSADKWSSGVEKAAEQQILLAAASVALADKERALNIVISERDRLLFTVDVIEDQRDELLTEALESDNPGAIAHALRDALARLRVGNTEKTTSPETLPGVSSSTDSDGN